MKQMQLLKKQKSAYGGELMKTRKGRSTPRPLATKLTMHLVLRSSKAKGDWSFRKNTHIKKLKEIVDKFASKYSVRVLSYANVGNHLHFHIQLRSRHGYKPFIRAMTASIAMAVTGASRWSPLKKEAKDRFWDYRPFTRIVESYKALLKLKDYIEINMMEGSGIPRLKAWVILEDLKKNGPWPEFG